ncbi:18207_t:CDS:1, partial [Racocetra fulgida]
TKLKRINFSLQARDEVIAARHTHRSTGAEIAIKLLAPYNNTNENQLKYARKVVKIYIQNSNLKD